MSLKLTPKNASSGSSALFRAVLHLDIRRRSSRDGHIVEESIEVAFQEPVGDEEDEDAEDSANNDIGERQGPAADELSLLVDPGVRDDGRGRGREIGRAHV